MDKIQCFVGGILIGLFVGFFLMSYAIKTDFHQQAIEHGAAHYDKVTGNWEWNNDNNR